MPVVHFHKFGSLRLFVWKWDTQEQNELGLSTAIRSKIEEQWHLPKRRREKFAQIFLLREAGFSEEVLFYHSNGKPKIASPGNYISFSHSHDLSGLLLSEKNCALDIEKKHPKIQFVSSKFLNQTDAKSIRSPDEMVWIWTIKEAIFKFFGSGVSFKDDIFVEHLFLNRNEAIASYVGRYGNMQFRLSLFRIENYYLAYTHESIRK
jgi:4'-phosphopantetheinyl transferase